MCLLLHPLKGLQWLLLKQVRPALLLVLQLPSRRVRLAHQQLLLRQQPLPAKRLNFFAQLKAAYERLFLVLRA
jgi:hypothetical protein